MNEPIMLEPRKNKSKHNTHDFKLSTTKIQPYHKSMSSTYSNPIGYKFKFSAQDYLNPQFLKEIENLDIDSLKIDKEKYKAELDLARKEHEDIKFHFDKYFTKTSIRESELRNHIHSLSSRVHLREVDKIKEIMQDLYDQVTENIDDVHLKIKEEILEKRKDIENRINIRLMDSDYRHRKVLDEKVKEQEGLLRSLHSITQDMARIKDNYLSVRKRIENFQRTSFEYSQLIEDEEFKNKKLKLELKQFKIYLNNLNNEIKKHNLKAEQSLKQQNNNFKRANSVNLNKIENKKLPQGKDKSQNVIEVLNKSSKHWRTKVSSLKKELSFILQCSTRIHSKVYEILRSLKSNFSDPFKDFKDYNFNFYNTTNVVATTNSILSHQNNEISSSSEDRKRFIELLVNDQEILNIFYDEKFPTINLAFRSMNMTK